MTRLLVTGGAGFIGSHTCLTLLKAGHDLAVLDDYSNSCSLALERVAELAELRSKSLSNDDNQRLKLISGDIRDSQLLSQIFSQANAADQPIEAVIHFAGLKAVGESVQDPMRYWDVNVNGSRCVLEAMEAHQCYTFVFSSLMVCS